MWGVKVCKELQFLRGNAEQLYAIFSFVQRLGLVSKTILLWMPQFCRVEVGQVPEPFKKLCVHTNSVQDGGSSLD